MAEATLVRRGKHLNIYVHKNEELKICYFSIASDLIVVAILILSILD